MNAAVFSLLLVFLFLALPVCKAELPPRSQELLRKLADYESVEQEKLNAVFRAKREAVAKLLQQQLEAETKKGNLVSALAIRDAIASLETDEAIVATAKGEDGGEPSADHPDDAKRHNRAYFKAYVTEEPITWEDAEKACEKVGGKLAWFDSPEDEPFIVGILREVTDRSGHAPVWVGGKKDRKENWVWLNEEPVNPEFWANDADAASDPTNNVMVRWVGSFKASAPYSDRVVGYICRWD